jgi:hypothetical protein
MPTRTPREAIRRQIINVVGFAFATGVLLMQAVVNWVRGERLLTALVLLSLAWLVFGIVGLAPLSWRGEVLGSGYLV